MYLHATGTIPDLDKLAPHRAEETRVLAELHAEGVVKSLFRLTDRPGVYLIVEADDVEEARRQVGRLPLVSHGLLLIEFESVEKLL
jgi:muconolactone delta-isomerase